MTNNIITLLNSKTDQYNTIDFIASDPISIPHRFTRKEDIEISGFLTSVIAWGRRTAIIKSANKLLDLMDNTPYDFLVNSDETNFRRFEGFVYRTFNSDDCLFLLQSLRNIYLNYGGLELIAEKAFKKSNNIYNVIIELRKHIFITPHLSRSEKHIANPGSGSAAKRMNMFLRWMVRQDDNGVDFGLWKNIPQSHLMCPLDVHSGNVARKLGLLHRKQNDWKAVEELTNKLRSFDNNDPVKYDFALFGMGVFEGVA